MSDCDKVGNEEYEKNSSSNTSPAHNVFSPTSTSIENHNSDDSSAKNNELDGLDKFLKDTGTIGTLDVLDFDFDLDGNDNDNDDIR